MNIKLLSLTAVSAVLFSTSALANPVIGFDPTGTGGALSGWLWADTWSFNADRGVDVKVTGAGGINDFAPGDVHTFHSQTIVGNFTDNSTPGGPGTYSPGNNTFPSGYELTKEYSLTDVVTSFVPHANGSGEVTFGAGEDFSSVLNIYYDTYSAADPSKANNGSGPANVQCYGSATIGATCATATDRTGAATQTGGPGEIGAILTAHMLSETSSFNADAIGHGTGSFDIKWKIDGYDPRYINLAYMPELVFADLMIGTLNQPATETPNHMWDNTPTAGNQVFDIVGRQVFETKPTKMPEPSSLALLGAGLLAMSGFSRRKKV